MVASKRAQDMPFAVAVLFTVVGTGLLAAGLYFVGSVVWVRFAYRPAAATVVEKRLGSESGKGGRRYHLEVLLEYPVGGHDYRGWVSLPRSTGEDSGPEAEAVLDQLQVGQPVTCFHDPIDPAAGLSLDRGSFEWPLLIAVLFPLLFLVGGIAGLVKSWRRTFPQGVVGETTDLLRRLPWRFYTALVGALLVAGTAFLTLRYYGNILGGWTCLLLPVAGATLLGLFRLVARYGAVALPSPERRAVLDQEAEPPPAAGAGAPASDWDRTEPVVTTAGERLPVRLKANWSEAPVGGLGLAAFWVSTFVLVALLVLPARWLLAVDSHSRVPVTMILTLLALVVAVAVVFAVGLLLLRRFRHLAVELSGHPLRPGGSHRVALSHPEEDLLRRLRLALVCTEEATGSGKGEKTTRHTARQPIALREQPGLSGAREGPFSLPDSAPASFKLQHHQVAWHLEVQVGRGLLWKLRYPVAIQAAPAESPAPEREERRVALDEGPVSVWVDGGRPVFAPGDALRGGYTVRPGDSGPLRTVELSVLWYTDPPESAELGVCHYEGHEAVEGDDLPLYRQRGYQVRLPDGPPSYDGQVVKVRWAVRLRLRYAGGAELVREVPFRLSRATPPPTAAH